MTPGPFAALIDDGLGRVIDRGDGLYDIVLERRIKKPVEKVWAALTTPERIADWFTEVELDLRLGGVYRLAFPQDDYRMTGEIVELVPLRRLAHTWPDETHPLSIVRYELEPDGNGCRLTLTQTHLNAKQLETLPGWHTFLEALPGAAEGVHTPWSWDREKAMGERYQLIIGR